MHQYIVEFNIYYDISFPVSSTTMWKKVFVIQFLCFLVNCTQTGVLILARGGSKGVYLKNLKKVGGVSLVCRAVNVAKAAGLYDVTVSTDHHLIAWEANNCNATILHRSPTTASDWAPSIWGAQEFLERRPDLQILVLIQATSPFTCPEQLRNALVKISEPTSFDCIFSVTRSYKLRWVYESDKLTPLNFNISKRPRRQNWSGEFLETGAFYIARRSLLTKGLFQNHNCSMVEVPSIYSLEIDSYDDLKLANTLLEIGLI